MNIVILNDYAFVNGGAGQVALSSAIALSNHAHSVTLFSAVGPVSTELRRSNLNIICTDQKDILKDTNRVRAAIQGVWNFKSERLLSKLLDSLDPSQTIIHIHSWTKAISSSVIRKIIKKGFKAVCTLHDYFSACPNGGFFNYPKNQICHLKPMSAACFLSNCDSRNYFQKLWRVLRQFVQKRVGLFPDKIENFITVSNYSRKILTPYLPSHAKMYSIRNPIDIRKSHPTEVERNHIYFSVGRLSKEKGPFLFAKAASIANCQATFLGDGELRSKIEQLFPEAKITGWLSHKGVMEGLKLARALVFPSLWHETQGMVVLEAAAVGIPTIVADTSAAREFVINGETGLWFKGGSLDDLIEKMNTLKDAKKVKKMGRGAYDFFWSTPPTMENHINALEKMYNEILKS